MKAYHFNYKDLFRAPRLAFSIQRIWINGTGLLLGCLVYLIFSYFSGIVGGYNCSYIWSKFGLLPCSFALYVPWYSTVIYLIGLALFAAIILLTNTAVSRVVYMALRDELFYTWTQAYKFAYKKWISSVGAMITFVFIIAFFVIAALVMGFIGRIPFVGELGTVLLTVPYIFASLLLLFIIISFVVGIFFVPAIIATSDEDALGGVFQSFSITYNQLWRIILYGILLLFIYVVGVFIFAAVFKVSYNIFISLFTMSMGDKILQLQQQALYIIDQALPTVYGWANLLPGDLGKWVYLTNPHPYVPDLSSVMLVSGYILGIFLLFLGGVVVAYGEALWNSGLTMIYVILYKLQEKENLLEREDEELKEDEEEEAESTPSDEVQSLEEPEPEKKVKKPAAKRKPRKSPAKGSGKK
jgi:hypothetical protein